MAYSRADVPELENLLKYGKKKFVRYDEGAKLYLHSAERSVHRCVLERPPCGAKRPPV